MIGLDDRYIRDANHVGEVMTAIQLFSMLEEGGRTIPILKNVNNDRLRQLIEGRVSEIGL